MFKSFNFLYVPFLFIGMSFSINSLSQNTSSTNSNSHLYRQQSISVRDKIIKPDTNTIDSTEIENIAEDKLKHTQDSIAARENFIRDSIIQKKKTIDSLKFLQSELPILINAGLLTQHEQILIHTNSLKIIGDSILSNYVFVILPFSFNQPFTPWINTINLNSSTFKIGIDTIKQKVNFIKAPQINWSYSYSTNSAILRIDELSIVKSKNGKNFYTLPLDSVFFDLNGRVAKIKHYAGFYQANEKYQKGNYLFNHLFCVKQFVYNSEGELLNYEVINFSDRWSKTDPVKVSTLVKYSIEKQGVSYKISRQNDPANAYSDGNFFYEFDAIHNLKSVSFRNFKNSENWKTSIELNEFGYVSRYVYEVNGNINSTLLINYFADGNSAKYRFETITCTFENDGISYYQKNNTSGKSRVRDKFTGEWSKWE